MHASECFFRGWEVWGGWSARTTTFEKRGPENGPKFGVTCGEMVRDGATKTAPLFSNARTLQPFCTAPHAHSQVATSWQWCNMLHKESPAGMLPLRVNMAETSVCMYQSVPLAGVCRTCAAELFQATHQRELASARGPQSGWIFVCHVSVGDESNC